VVHAGLLGFGLAEFTDPKFESGSTTMIYLKVKIDEKNAQNLTLDFESTKMSYKEYKPFL
jgi:hypothetical protein